MNEMKKIIHEKKMNEQKTDDFAKSVINRYLTLLKNVVLTIKYMTLWSFCKGRLNLFEKTNISEMISFLI